MISLGFVVERANAGRIILSDEPVSEVHRVRQGTKIGTQAEALCGLRFTVRRLEDLADLPMCLYCFPPSHGFAIPA